MSETKSSEAFRERVYALTLPALKRRVRRKRALLACAVGAAYAVGIFSAGLFAGSTPAAMRSVTGSPGTHVAQAGRPRPPADGMGEDERAALAATKQTPAQRREALRAAGNRCLNEQGDIERATRLYGSYLDAAPAEELNRFDPQDTWLLRTLRCARIQENRHENASI
jgi:hypothetical protein